MYIYIQAHPCPEPGNSGCCGQDLPSLEVAKTNHRASTPWIRLDVEDPTAEELTLEKAELVWNTRISDLVEQLAGTVPVVHAKGKMGRKHARRVVRRELRRREKEEESEAISEIVSRDDPCSVLVSDQCMNEFCILRASDLLANPENEQCTNSGITSSVLPPLATRPEVERAVKQRRKDKAQAGKTQLANRKCGCTDLQCKDGLMTEEGKQVQEVESRTCCCYSCLLWEFDCGSKDPVIPCDLLVPLEMCSERLHWVK